MKHRLKGLLALVLSLAMVLGLMTCAWGAPYGIWVGDTQVNDINAANVLAGDSNNAGKVSYDATTNTLTLNGANIGDTYDRYGIRAGGDLTINLIGDNKVMPADESGAYGVWCSGTLTIKGPGILTAVGESQSGGYGIHATSIVITEGTVIAQGSASAVDVNTTPSFGTTHKATASEYFNGSPESAYDENDINLYEYLKIEPITCTVTFDLKGHGTMTTATQTDIPKGDKVTEPNPAPTEDGWTFGGWYTDDGAWTDEWKFDVDTVTSDITLYAKWTENTYTVKFNANGGSGTMNDATGVSGDYTLPANGFTAPVGDEFFGWSVDPAGAERKLPGETMQITRDTTVYAIWKYATLGNQGGGYPGTPQPPSIYYPIAPTTPAPEVTAPKTFDSGVALHIGLTILAASGSAWLAKKKD